MTEADGVDRRGRWPDWVYGSGAEPDVRFTFANERTFLAWIRTALALLAAGVALDTVDLDLPDAAQRILAAFLVVSGLACAAWSWIRWARAERAIRHGRELPGLAISVTLAGVIVAIAVTVLILGLLNAD